MNKRRILSMTVALAGLIFTMLLAGFLTLKRAPTVTVVQPTSTINIEEFPELIQFVDPQIAQAVTAATDFTLKTGIREAEVFGGGKSAYLSLMLVSTGEQDTLVIEDHLVDVVYAYLLTQNGVVRLPAALGFQDNENYYALDGSAAAFVPADRGKALENLHQALPKGQTFGLTILGASYKDGVNRTNCSIDWSPAWCELAKQYNQAFGDTERQFLSRIVTDRSWLPVGWLLTLYPPEDTLFSQVIQLP